MKILTLHVDYINFKPLKKALKSISELSEEEKKPSKIKEALAVMTAVEEGDDVKNSVKELVKNVKEISEKVKAETIVLYPYAHLSSNLAKPDLAMEVLEKAKKELGKDFKVAKAPFGYYKEFEMKVKGHPLSELSREIKSGQSNASPPTHPSRKNNEKNNVAGSNYEEKDLSENERKNLLRSIGKSVLDRSKLKANDHRILGQEMDLFSFNGVAPGSVFWHNDGKIIFNELVDFSRELHKRFGYVEVETPQVLDNKLWKISGHWNHYRGNMFISDYEGRDFGVKPMNCPGMMLIYKARKRSYKELPIRMFEFGKDHRVELSGVLAGLFRLIQFTQDDAHIFCTKEQIGKEVERVIQILDVIYQDTFGMDYRLELSTRPKKYMGDKKDWDYAEEELEKVLKKSKVKFKLNKGDGAFYGPKVDIHVKDSLGRSWQTATIQLDMQMPKRFGLNYKDKNNEEKTPMVIHRAIFGSIERFIGILLENTNGRLPTWLAPIQVRVLSFADRNENYARKVIKSLGEKIPNLRIDADFRSITVPGKVKEAEIMKVPYIVVVGDKEEKGKSIALRTRGEKKIKNVGLDSFVKSLKKEIDEKK